ncbi:PREDICTED: uncharacterized protein LOC108370331 [Rhagoletis zephyria]|uniref:uncharacterized protein LOC108370331 n=1 Tax=Rhagoletis zephyria TaxID=28612 RepID=UPI00081139C7|nr:PREDICTED: uncharacterized protein LOC108370331 [Rhagoletis zephyria]
MSAKKTSIPGAQRDKRYVEKLKESNKYDEYKKKKAEAMKKLRANRKEEEKLMPISELGKTISMRRAAGRKRSKKYRQKLKQSAKDTQIEPAALAKSFRKATGAHKH